MAIIRSRKNNLYIQWYDPLKKGVQTKALGLSDTEANRKKAAKIVIKFQNELDKQKRKKKNLGILDITISDAFNHFLKNNKKKHPKTIKDYHRFYTKFTETFNENFPCSELTKLKVEDWLLDIQELPLAQNSIHGYGKQLVHFLNFLFEYDYTPIFKINREVMTKPETKEIIVFTDEDLKIIFDELKTKNSNFQTTIWLLFYTGLRPTDILTIVCDKIDFDKRSIKYYSPKRKKFREIAFHKDLVQILKKRVDEVGSGNLIQYKNVESLGRAVNRYIRKICLYEKGYTARTFRKTFITLCRSRYNMDATLVKELVGHEHKDTTDKYYNKITVPILRKEIDLFQKPF